MIIFGTRKFKFKKGETKNKKHCEGCGHDSKWHLVSIWSWFDLFFVPLFPVSRKKFLICPMCNCGVEVKGENRDQIMRKVEMDT